MYRSNQYRGWFDGHLEMEAGFVYGDLQGVCKDNATILCSNEEGNITEGFTVTTASVGQRIGLTDSNGQDIFEGDIIRRPNGDWGVVVWKAPNFEVTVSADQSSSYSREYFAHVEVIGNVTENPELLNAE